MLPSLGGGGLQGVLLVQMRKGLSTGPPALMAGYRVLVRVGRFHPLASFRCGDVLATRPLAIVSPVWR